ncbi:MAG: HesA/MoeB/ThiF family protein [Phycisphaerae bacterium]
MSDTGSVPYDFSRQTAFAPLGPAGQRRLEAARVLLVGAGGLGSWMAELLARSGIGFLRLVDDDCVSDTNLHRQTLYTPGDAGNSTLKVHAAARALGQIAPHTRVEARPVRLTAQNAPVLADGVDVLLDGTDNFLTRFILNDLAVRSGRAWVFAGAAGAAGQVMAIRPGRTACLRCLYESPPPPEMELNAQSVGIIAPIVSAIAAIAVGKVIRLLAKEEADGAGSDGGLIQLELWKGLAKRSPFGRREDCPCCGERRFEFLEVVP